MTKRIIKILLLPLSILVGQAVVSVTDTITADTKWTNNNTYLLAKQIFVMSPAVLTIEEGTTIKATQDDGNGLAPALVITQSAKIIANGTAQEPITFTSALSEAELAASPRGNWGGLIVLGKAPITGGIDFVEGITGVPYGGTDPNDDSGILRYVRVWHGGRSIGQDNEINGITLAGVGDQTVVEYCEVAYNLDDGFEMFGGTVNLKYCSVLWTGDDAFDTDEGYRGKGQFLFAIVGDENGNRAYEMDSKFDSQPRSMPQFANVTLIGSGADQGSADNDDMMRIREGTGGVFWNHIVVNGHGDVVDIRDCETAALLGDSLVFSSSNIYFNYGSDAYDLGDVSSCSPSPTAPAFLDVDPQLAAVTATHETGGMVDPRPFYGSPSYSDVDQLPADGFFTQTDYKGAFGAWQWLEHWSWLSEHGRLGTSILGVDSKEENIIPMVLSVSNYPNPFNPVTIIKYGLPSKSSVTLKVFDIIGNLVMEKTYNNKRAGFHNITWNAKNQFGTSVSTGLYFYQIKAGNEILTEKMMLMR
tara:strand:- start:953 stop:2542 length:1590 start_codon:yes stop_codon:yes gene_type:complete